MGQFDTLLKELRKDKFGELLKMFANGSQNPCLEVEERISSILEIKKQYTLLLCECKKYMQNGLNATENCDDKIRDILGTLDDYETHLKTKVANTNNNDENDLIYSINLERIQLFGHIVKMYDVLEWQGLLIKISNFWDLIARESEAWMTIQERIITVKSYFIQYNTLQFLGFVHFAIFFFVSL